MCVLSVPLVTQKLHAECIITSGKAIHSIDVATVAHKNLAALTETPRDKPRRNPCTPRKHLYISCGHTSLYWASQMLRLVWFEARLESPFDNYFPTTLETNKSPRLPYTLDLKKEEQ